MISYWTNSTHQENQRLQEDARSILRGKTPHCGRWQVFDTATGQSDRFYCNQRNCILCTGHWRKKIRGKVNVLFEPVHDDERTRFPIALLTLTFDPKHADGLLRGQSRDYYAKSVLNKFWTYLKRRRHGGCLLYKKLQYFWVMEYHREDSSNKYPHFHILLDRRPKVWHLKECWAKAGGGLLWECPITKQSGVTSEVNICRIKDKEGAAGYLTKYLLKDSVKGQGQGKTTLERVPATMRTYGYSRDWNPGEKKLLTKDSRYVIIKEYVYPCIYDG